MWSRQHSKCYKRWRKTFVWCIYLHVKMETTWDGSINTGGSIKWGNLSSSFTFIWSSFISLGTFPKLSWLVGVTKYVYYKDVSVCLSLPLLILNLELRHTVYIDTTTFSCGVDSPSGYSSYRRHALQFNMTQFHEGLFMKVCTCLIIRIS